MKSINQKLKEKQLEKKRRKGQTSISDAPTIVLLVGLTFLIMATIALVGEEYDKAVDTDNTTDTVAENVTRSLNQEIDDNTSIAGIVLTISLIGIVLTVLIGVFVGIRSRGV